MIHHYTSVNTLALILETKKIRFTRLDCFDDMLEAKSVQGIDFGNKLFASCWTKANESIPQWYMYGSQLSGIRISFLPDDLFIWSQLLGGREVKKNGKSVGMNIPLPLDAPYSIEDMYGYGYSLVPEVDMKQRFLRDIEYVDNLDVILKEFENRISTTNGVTTINGMSSDFGFHKSSTWSFQEESRFILTAANFPQRLNVTDDHFFDFYMQGGHLSSIKVKNIDLPYNPNALDHLLVTLGPSTTKADEIIVTSLLEKFAPKAQLKRSDLCGKIRNNFK